MADIGESYREVSTALVARIEQRSEIKPKTPVPKIADKKVLVSLNSLSDHFETLRTGAYGAAKRILGGAFDESNAKAIETLGTAVAQARGLIETAALAKHSSAVYLNALDGITLEQFGAVESLVAKIRSQAAELAKLYERPDVASRISLYAKVAQWLRDESGGNSAPFACPVCGVSLAGKKDELTDELIADHLGKLAAREAEHLSMALEAWATGAKDRLTSDLPEGLAAWEKQGAVSDPRVLLERALCGELFTASAFTGVLSPLATEVTELCKTVVMALPACAVPEMIDLPECFGKGSRLEIMLNGVMRAAAFARWTKKTREARQDAIERVIGLVREEGEGENIKLVSSSPLSDRLAVLHNVIHSAAPLRNALKDLAVMSRYVKDQSAAGVKMLLYEKAAKALDQLQSLEQLVDIKVGSVVAGLAVQMKGWKGRLYHAASTNAPQVIKADVGENGSLVVEADIRGTTAPAHHICNTSDLRATLLAFLIAFREYVNENRGGLSLLLLDDPQELFDRPNRERVAASMAAISESGARIILTTNDEPFRKHLVIAAQSIITRSKIAQLRIHPRRAIRPVIELGVFSEDVDDKRREFEKPENENEDQPARDYIKSLRQYLERRLTDLFDTPEAGLALKPTLATLINAVRARNNHKVGMFAKPVFDDIVNMRCLKQDACGPGTFLYLMNKSHHGRENEIFYMDVYRVRGECRTVRKRVDAAHQEYDLWLRRDPPPAESGGPAIPEPIRFPSFNVPVVENLAAADGAVGPGEPEEIEVTFCDDAMANHAMYLINSPNFGFAGVGNCVAIVDLAEDPPPTNSLVIALHEEEVYARRYLGRTGVPAVVLLGSEEVNPLRREPVLLLPMGDTRLLRVAGMCFTDEAVPADISDEASRIEPDGFLAGVVAALKVIGDSALPFALSGQAILVGKSVTSADLDSMGNSMLALDTDGGMILKRIGDSVPGIPHLRHFESVGGLGDSTFLVTEEVDDGYTAGLAEIPRFIGAREVLGVWYDPI